MTAPCDKGLLISTPNQGKQVIFAPSIEASGLLLKQAARQGYYYPMLALKHLNALSTGLSGKRNVFIPNTTVSVQKHRPRKYLNRESLYRTLECLNPVFYFF